MAAFLRLRILSVLLFGLVFSSLHAAPPARRVAPGWRHIYYPSVEIPLAKGEVCSVLVGCDVIGDEPTLRCDVLWSGRGLVPAPEVFMKPGGITVKLHGPEGPAVAPTNRDDFPLSGTTGGGGITWSRMFFFPWAANRLAEAWFELRIDERTYWVEVPYGLARNPAAALPPSEADGGPPTLAPAMRKMAPGDRIVPWQKSDYDLGVIQNGWRMQLEKSNVPEAHWLVVLYREGEPWVLEKPKISVKLAVDGGAELTPKWVIGRLPDPFRRTDEYVFPSEAGKGRAWGTLTIGVDKKLTSVVIPSSLFRDGHSIAEPSHPQRLKPESSR